MALSRAKTWTAGEVLYASDLNNEFNNILNNPISLISPLTGAIDANSQDITGLDELGFNDADADATAVGRIRRTNESLEYHDRTGSWPLQLLVGGGIFGLTLSNNSGDATNDIDIAAGQTIDDTEIYTLRLASSLTKRLDAAWAVGTNQGGLDTGSIANDVYHVFIIKRSDTGVTDILFSASATSPTMPTNYDYKRLIGSFIRAGATILAFTQDGDYVRLTTSVLDISAANPGANAVTATLASVPDGISVWALIGAGVIDSGGAGRQILVSDLAAGDEDPAATTANFQAANFSTANAGVWQGLIRTNTSGQVRYRLSGSGANTTAYIRVYGWWHPRGANV